MNNEDFVSYEIAQLLYALDFDLNCEMAYFDRPWNHEHRLVSAIDACNQQCAYDGTDVYPAPTLAKAQKWLREKKGIYVYPEINMLKKWFAKAVDMCKNEDLIWDGTMFDTYESALSAGIEGALKFIEKESI